MVYGQRCNSQQYLMSARVWDIVCVCMWIDKQGCSALPCPAFRNIIKTDCTISTKHEINKYPFRFVSCCISIKCHAIVHNSLKRKCPVCRGKCNCNNWTFCHNQNCIVTRLRSNWMQTYSLWHRIAKCFGSILFFFFLSMVHLFVWNVFNDHRYWFIFSITFACFGFGIWLLCK